jgi:cyanate lyase
MLQAEVSPSARQRLAETAVANTAAKGLSWKAVAEGTGLSVVFVTAAVLGQHPLPKAAAEIVGQRLGLERAHARRVPRRRGRSNHLSLP